MQGSQKNKSDLIHIWNHCHGCGEQPIVGRRFECQVCPAGPNNDLCEKCYEQFARGGLTHPAAGSYSEGRVTRAHTFRAFDGSPYCQYLDWLVVPQVELPAPKVPDNFVVRPEFCCRTGSFFGSYAFAIRRNTDASFVVLTALHVMDEVIKSNGLNCTAENVHYSGQELPALVAEVRLYDAFAPVWMLAELGVARPMLILPNARTGYEEPISHCDIAAFHASTEARLTAVLLAKNVPAMGAPIWLVANAGKGARSRTFEAVVVEATDHTFVFRFSKSAQMPLYTSGAPLIDQNGHVVGINVGGGFLAGHRFGHGNHVASIRQHLGAILTGL